MSLAIESVREEFRPMLSLAWPVVMAELGWMAMGIVDTMMVGRVSADGLEGLEQVAALSGCVR